MKRDEIDYKVREEKKIEHIRGLEIHQDGVRKANSL
jgi:hypothetical protein